MIRSSLFAAASAFVLAACASTAVVDTDQEPVASEVEDIAVQAPSQFDIGMQTAADLVVSGHTQVAIARLEQLAGHQDLTKDELASVLLQMGELRMGEIGFDTMGAIGNFEEIINELPDTPSSAAAETNLNIARGKATSIGGLLAQPETTQMQRFNLLMDLGEHQDAIDVMIQHNLSPDNATLVAMYDIGYLCEGDGLTGRAYDMTEPDGTFHSLRFCDFGK
ncbi:MAG: hypothetical protein ACRBEQ_11140 [Hyphomonas sp.]